MRKVFFICCVSLLFFYSEAQVVKSKEIYQKENQLRLDGVKSYWALAGSKLKRTDVVMLIHMINNHFNLGLKLTSVSEYKRILPELNNSYLKIYDQVYDNKTKADLPDAEVYKMLEDNLNNIDYVTLWSMYSNVYKPNDKLIAEIQKRMNAGNFDLTHAALQLQFLKDNRAYNEAILNHLIDECTAKLLAFINGKEVYAYNKDVRIEAIVMLMYLKRYDLITPQMVEFIYSAQKESGGFIADEKSTKANEHTTLLGLWALAEINQNFNKIFK